MKTITFGCLTALLTLCLGVMVVAMSIEAIATAGATKTVAREQTRQVEIEQTQATERTRIEWDARTEIAGIEADAVKKTSWAFLGLTIWQTATLIWACAIALFLMYRKGWI